MNLIRKKNDFFLMFLYLLYKRAIFYGLFLFHESLASTLTISRSFAVVRSYRISPVRCREMYEDRVRLDYSGITTNANFVCRAVVQRRRVHGVWNVSRRKLYNKRGRLSRCWGDYFQEMCQSVSSFLETALGCFRTGKPNCISRTWSNEEWRE